MSNLDSAQEAGSASRASLHALRRVRQRGLREADLVRVQRHGEEVDAGYLMTDRTVAERITELKSEIQRLERLRGVVLIEQDGTLVTVYRSARRRQRELLSGEPRRQTTRRSAHAA